MKLITVVLHCTLWGWVISILFFLGDKEGQSRFKLNGELYKIINKSFKKFKKYFFLLLFLMYI